MAMKADRNCPICQETISDSAYVTSCCHEFCLGCIMSWVKRNPSCPLCRQSVGSIIYSVQSNIEFLEVALPRHSHPLAVGQLAEQAAVESVPRPFTASFPPEVWAMFFRNNREVLQSIQFWLNEVLYAACSWDVAFAQGRIISTLCRFGLNEETLVHELLPLLQDQTVMFVRQLIDVALNRCSEQILRQIDFQGSHTAEEHSPTTSGSVASPEGMSATNASTQVMMPHEDPVEGATGADQSRGSSPGDPQNTPTRRASCSHDAPAQKKPCHRQL